MNTGNSTELYPDVSGKKVLVLTKHDTIGQAIMLNLEYILHLTVKLCTINRNTDQHRPVELIDFNPEILLVAEPADMCDVTDLFSNVPWLQCYEHLPILALCEQPEIPIHSKYNIYSLQFPYEQEELHAKLATILFNENTTHTNQPENLRSSKTSVLIVEDDPIIAADLQGILTGLGYIVCGSVGTGADALPTSIEQKPDIILMDVSIYETMESFETANRTFIEIDIPIVFVIPFADKAKFEKVNTKYPFGYVLRPFDEREVHTAVEIALYKHEVESELQRRVEELYERNAEIDAFTWVVTHEVRDPVNITRDLAEILARASASLPADEIQHSLEVISELTNRVRDSVDNMVFSNSSNENATLKQENMIDILLRAEKRLEALKRKCNAEYLYS